MKPMQADPLVIAGRSFNLRLFLGTAGYPNQQVMLDCLDASGAELVTASIRRISLEGYAESLVDILGGKYRLLPNTAGCVTSRDAILTAELAREARRTRLLRNRLRRQGNRVRTRVRRCGAGQRSRANAATRRAGRRGRHSPVPHAAHRTQLAAVAHKEHLG